MLFMSIRVILGIFVVLFLPGFLFVTLMFKDRLDLITKILVSVLSSIFFNLLVFFIFSVYPKTSNFFGGTSAAKIMISLLIISSLFYVLIRFTSPRVDFKDGY